MFVGDHFGSAEEAIDLYVSAFEGSRVVSVERYDAEADGMTGIKRARLQLAGLDVVAMDGPGPHAFTFTPAISMVVDFDDEAELDAAWARLIEGGGALMPLQAYDFAPKFGWLADRYGVSWQLILVPAA
jgi:predicted 3-demethylubiquinone-9 3-methyltransferase (glyoxalase superfamily)